MDILPPICMLNYKGTLDFSHLSPTRMGGFQVEAGQKLLNEVAVSNAEQIALKKRAAEEEKREERRIQARYRHTPSSVWSRKVRRTAAMGIIVSRGSFRVPFSCQRPVESA